MASKLQEFGPLGIWRQNKGAIPQEEETSGSETSTPNFCILYKSDGSRGPAFDYKDQLDLYSQLAYFYPDWCRAEVFEDDSHVENIDRTVIGGM